MSDPTKDSEYLKGFDSFTPAQTREHWTNVLNDLVLGYRRAIDNINVDSLLHPVQKDGIQNGWDARLDIYGPSRPWKMTFELFEDTSQVRRNAGVLKTTLLTITDEGTYGLTGRHIDEEELYENLSEHERLARFQNKSWQKDSSGERKYQGSKGRGKFIFVGVSNDRTLFFDSLRYGLKNSNGNTEIDYGQTSYCFGWREIRTHEAPYMDWTDYEAKKKLEQFSKNVRREREIQPLQEVGTRVIIPKPLDEIVESFKNGDLEKWIGSTFRDIIINEGADIRVKFNGKETKVKPYPPKYPDKDTNTYVATILEDVHIHQDLKNYTDKDGEKQNMKCKKLHLAYSYNKDVDQEIQGIAIIRTGIKIMSYMPSEVPAEDRKKFFGYITLEDGWDKPIRDKESDEHYDIILRGNPLHHLANFLKEETEKFGMDKGIWSATKAAKKDQLMKRSQNAAMRAVNKIAQDLGFTGKGLGPNDPPDQKEPLDPEPIRIIMPRLKFPDKDHPLRVNYDELVKGINVSAISQRSAPFNVRVSVNLFVGEPKSGEVHHNGEMLNVDTLLYSNQAEDLLKDNIIAFKKEDFPITGRYTLVARLVSMEPDDSKGDVLDLVAKAIYLEEDPPKHGLFERTEAAEFTGEHQKIECKIRKGEHESYVFLYNRKHPRCQKNADDAKTLFDFLTRLMLGQLVRIDLRQAADAEKCHIFKEEDFEEADTMSGKERIVAKTLEFVGQALYDVGVG